MAKQQHSLKYIYKIHSSRLRMNKWNLKLTFTEAKKNKEIISLADNSVLRFIREINNYNYSEEDVKKIKKQIKTTKKMPNSKENIEKITQLYEKLNKILFVEDYVSIIMDSNKDFDRCNLQKGFFINGVKFKRLLGTTGGIKKSTVVYVSERVYDELTKRVDNNRNTNVNYVPAKLEAYKALACSASVPVSNPKGVLVIKDGETEFNANIIKIDDTDTNNHYPKLSYEKEYPIKFNFADGCAMLLPSLSERWSKELGENYISSGFNIRNAYCKGMVFTFNFLDFAENVAHKYIVKDAWGNDVDIRNVELILTTNMLKLWDSYSSLENYLESCKINGYKFSVAKICPEELENERNMNYQFLQSYNLSEEDIDELIAPTIKEIHDVLDGDYRKTLLFARGIKVTEENADIGDYDYIKALTIDKDMMNDPFVKHRIYSLIEKRIKDAKIGVVKVSGNYSIVAGDLYATCQYMFGMEVTGLLKANEFYSQTWLDKGVNRVVAFRAPMTCHNNIRIMNFIDNNEVRHWYKYIKTCTVLNAWDTTTHAMNGEDFDSDAVITTDNPVLLKNTQELDALICVQKSAIKKVVDEKDLIKSNKDGFGDEIGTTTNRITTMFEVLANFKEDSPEYRELMYRIMCGQHYQQTAIDKIKGIISNPMPKEWYEYKPNKINDNDDEEIIKKKEFNQRILADKKPYFFTYIYPNIMSSYNKYIRDTNANCLMRFGVSVDELIQKANKTEDEELYLYYYYLKMPVGNSSCLLNQICWKIEKEFDGFLGKIKYDEFDFSVLKSEKDYSEEDYKKVKILLEEYNREIRQYAQTTKKEKIEKEERKLKRQIFKDTFKEKAFEICNNEDELCNMIVDLCYKSNTSKQFAWDIVGETIIKNLLKHNNYKIIYPTLDENGDIEFGGYKFSMQEKIIGSEDEIE
jgi:sulfur relay (sulfurtransferase) DsrC/TusE family protein